MKLIAALLTLLLPHVFLAPAAAQDLDDTPRTAAEPERTSKKDADKTPPAEDLGLVGARDPHLSPDGRQLAFSLYGDLWVMPAKGGRATRLTLNEANDIRPVWSPDGKHIAFTSDRSGNFDVFTMPADGGVPTRITFDGASDHISEYSPDGRSLVFQSSRTGTWRIFSVSVNGGTPTPITLDGGTVASISPTDGLVYYQRSISDTIRKGYRGSASDDIYRCRPGELPERLTASGQNDKEPHVTPDGKRLYFLRETGKSGKDFNLHLMALDTRKVTPVTSLGDLGIRHISFNADYTTVHFIWKYRIHSLDLTDEKAKPVLLPVSIMEDTRRDPVSERTSSSGASTVDISRDGKTIAFSLSGAIWTMGSGGGQARLVTKPGSGDTVPRFSPDGSRIAFSSGTRTGNSDLFLVKADGSELRQLTFHTKDDLFHNWSPDGSYLVFCSTRSGNKDIWKLALDGSPPVQLTANSYVEDDPSVSPDGRVIAYDAWANGNADLFVMNADGTGSRRVYGTPAHDESPRFSPDGRLLVFTRTSTSGTSATREVLVTDLAGSGEARIGRGNGGVFTPDGREIIYLDSRGHIKAAPAPQNISGGRTISFLATQERSQKERFTSTFDEAWSTVARNFYDKKYHGVNWAEVRDRYRPLAVNAKTRMEFYHYVREMLGLLNASHQGISGSINDVSGIPTGLLGCELVPEAMEGEGSGKPSTTMLRLRVVRLEQDGPADKAWIREGDYVFGVGGKRLTVMDNFYERLENSAGKAVSLIVGSRPDAGDLRTVSVTPERASDQRRRKYAQWVKRGKKTVKDGSKGKVAYIHIPAMNSSALRRFQSELANRSVQKAKALILDIRDNGGGNIHQALIDILLRRHYAINTYRTRRPTKAPALFWQRPIVLLINERSFSDAEVFPHAFRTLDLGTIVGVPTPGAVIGTHNVTLGDGSRFRVTKTGFKNLDGTNQEGNGCKPDVEVPMTAKDRIEGNDPQLAKALEIALDQVKPKPKPKPEPKEKATPEPAGKAAGESAPEPEKK